MEIRELKDHIKAAARYLSDQGIEVPHTRLLEAFSRTVGERNWATLRARMSPADAHRAQAGPLQVEAFDWSPEKGPMSEVQFVHYAGNRCPCCGSDNLEAEDLQADGPDVFDQCACLDCGAHWKTAYKVCGYFGLSSAASARETPAPKPWTPEANDVIALYDLSPQSLRWRVHLFEARHAVPELARHYGTSPSGALPNAEPDQNSPSVLREAGLVPLHVEEHLQLRQAYRRAIKKASELGQRVLHAVREDVVKELVEDVRERMSEHEFTPQGPHNAFELAWQSAETLNLEVSPEELLQASLRL